MSRDEIGRFISGSKLTIEEKKKQLENLHKYIGIYHPNAIIKKENPCIFNAWRSMMYSKKGKQIGCSTESWKKFENFFNDVYPTYKKGCTFHRVDTSLPFSKDNFIWATNEQISYIRKKNSVYIDYRGEHLTLKETSLKYDQPYNAVRLRYYRHKNDLSIEEIIFGKKIKVNSKIPQTAIPESQQERNKASKMISTYKCKDKKKGFEICDIDIDWMINNIFHKPCIYCGDTKNIGCDRIDNSKGHIKSNVVPCCYSCNIVRNNTFTYKEMLLLGKTIKQIKENRGIKTN